MTPENYIKQIIRINKCLLFYEVGATDYSNKELIKKIIAWNLPGQIQIKFVSKGGDQETGLDKVKSLINACAKTVEVQKEYKKFKKSKNKDMSSKKKGDQNNSKEKAGKTNSKPNPCRKHNGEHKWKDCPDNHKNQKTKKSNDNKSSKQGELFHRMYLDSQLESLLPECWSWCYWFQQQLRWWLICWNSQEFHDQDPQTVNNWRWPSQVIVLSPIKPGQPRMYAARGLLDMCCTKVVAKKTFAKELIWSSTYHQTHHEQWEL